MVVSLPQVRNASTDIFIFHAVQLASCQHCNRCSSWTFNTPCSKCLTSTWQNICKLSSKIFSFSFRLFGQSSVSERYCCLWQSLSNIFSCSILVVIASFSGVSQASVGKFNYTLSSAGSSSSSIELPKACSFRNSSLMEYSHHLFRILLSATISLFSRFDSSDIPN